MYNIILTAYNYTGWEGFLGFLNGTMCTFLNDIEEFDIWNFDLNKVHVGWCGRLQSFVHLIISTLKASYASTGENSWLNYISKRQFICEDGNWNWCCHSHDFNLKF